MRTDWAYAGTANLHEEESLRSQAFKTLEAGDEEDLETLQKLRVRLRVERLERERDEAQAKIENLQRELEEQTLRYNEFLGSLTSMKERQRITAEQLEALEAALDNGDSPAQAVEKAMDT